MDDVENKLIQLIQRFETRYPGNAPEKIAAFDAAARSYRQLGKPALAIPLYQKILAIQEATEATPSIGRVNMLSNLSTVLAVTECYDQAAAITREMIRVLCEHHPTQPAALYSAMNILASCYLGMKAYDRAETTYLDLLELAATVLKAEDKSIAATYHNLGILYHQTGNFTKSETMFLTALSRKRQLWGPLHPDVGLTLRTLANVYSLHGHADKARALKAEADAILGDEPKSP